MQIQGNSGTIYGFSLAVLDVCNYGAPLQKMIKEIQEISICYVLFHVTCIAKTRGAIQICKMHKIFPLNVL